MWIKVIDVMLILVWCNGVFFFFQAEDGIRDHCVTGVQTCALPISRSPLPQVRVARDDPIKGLARARNDGVCRLSSSSDRKSVV